MTRRVMTLMLADEYCRGWQSGEPTEVAPEMTASSKKPSEANGYALTLNPAHP